MISVIIRWKWILRCWTWIRYVSRIKLVSDIVIREKWWRHVHLWGQLKLNWPISKLKKNCHQFTQTSMRAPDQLQPALVLYLWSTKSRIEYSYQTVKSPPNQTIACLRSGENTISHLTLWKYGSQLNLIQTIMNIISYIETIDGKHPITAYFYYSCIGRSRKVEQLNGKGNFEFWNLA